MSPLYLYNGKLLVENGALANNINCCCSTGCPTPPCTGIYCYASDLYGEVDCNRAGVHKHTITIPDEYTLPVPINITGSVDDDLLIDGQSVTIDLGYDPGPYGQDAGEGACVTAHTIGSVPAPGNPGYPGPFQDPVHGGITFPMNNRTFEVSARDTVLSNHILDITICIDPDNTQNVCLPVLVTGCCLSGIDLYCFEKTIHVNDYSYVGGEIGGYDCVVKLCATGVPEGETGWTQIGGPYGCDCEDCENVGNCIEYTSWKIIDQSNYVYASGDINYNGGNGLLDDLPNPFTPLFYNSAGEKNFKLQGYCSGGAWHDLQTWTDTITLCGNTDARYPSESFGGGWEPQGDCSKPVNENGDFVCDLYGNSSSTCPFLSPGTQGDGQAWRDPQPSGAYRFTGAVDGEWTNLANWEDSGGLSPAASLPDANSVVEINGAVTSISKDTSLVNVKEITVLSAGSIGTTGIETEKLTVYGSINNNGICDTESGDDYGYINVTGSAVDSCVFDGGNINYGKVTAPNTTVIFTNGATVTGDLGSGGGNSSINPPSVISCEAKGVVFENGSSNGGYIKASTNEVLFKTGTTNSGRVEGVTTFQGTSTNSSAAEIFGGSVKFYGTSSNDGVVETSAEFYDNSTNSGRIGTLWYVEDTILKATFYGTSHTTGTNSNILGKALFYDSAYSSGTVTTRWVEYNETSYNTGTVKAGNIAFFNEDSYNEGSITGIPGYLAGIPSSCDFYGNSINKSTGSTVAENTQIYGKNQGSITVQDPLNISGRAVKLRGTGLNDTTGTINISVGNIEFYDTSRNKGTLNGYADFTNGGCNDGGTLNGGSNPDPAPVC